jgi:hypothetical protein
VIAIEDPESATPEETGETIWQAVAFEEAVHEYVKLDPGAIVTTGPSEPFALISAVTGLAGAGAAARLTVTESLTLSTPSVQVTVKVVEPPTAG